MDRKASIKINATTSIYTVYDFKICRIQWLKSLQSYDRKWLQTNTEAGNLEEINLDIGKLETKEG